MKFNIQGRIMPATKSFELSLTGASQTQPTIGAEFVDLDVSARA
jgi:hypothetical protein